MGTPIGMQEISQAPPRIFERTERLQKVAAGLGWFSIGLGAAEVFAPGLISKLVGSSGGRGRIRAFGAREIGAGAGILTQRRKAAWIWARFAGDLLDLAALGAVIGSSRSRRGRAIAATAAVAGVTVVDALCAQRLGQRDA